jgi:replicative DNA helicase
MTKGEEFLLSVCQEADTSTFLVVRGSWLFEPREKKMYDMISSYLRSFGKLPPVEEVKSKFRLAYKGKLAMPNYYVRELKSRYIYAEMALKAPGIVSSVKHSPVKALTDMRELIESIEQEESIEAKTYGLDGVKRFESYLKRKEADGISYLPTNIPVLDEETLGYDRTDLWTIAGRSGLGKTWFLCYLLVELQEYLQSESELEGDILLISKEMSAEQLSIRIDSIITQLSYEQLRRGSLSESDEKKYERFLRRVAKIGSRLRIVDDCKDLARVRTLCMIYRPSLIAIDGSYLLEPESRKEGWQKIQYITSSLKDVSMTYAPVIQTTQMGRGTGKKKSAHFTDAQDDFSFGLSYIQDSDYAIRMYQDADMVYRQEIGLEFAKFRHVKKPNTLIWTRDETSNTYEITVEEVSTPATVSY